MRIIDKETILCMALMLLIICDPLPVMAKMVLVTVDNDIFLARDDGYTNGFFVSWLNPVEAPDIMPKPSWLLFPLWWSLPEAEPLVSINAHTIGQVW